MGIIRTITTSTILALTLVACTPQDLTDVISQAQAAANVGCGFVPSVQAVIDLYATLNTNAAGAVANGNTIAAMVCGARAGHSSSAATALMGSEDIIVNGVKITGFRTK